MMGHNDQLPDLFKKLVDDQASEEEVLLFLKTIRTADASDDLHAEMETLWNKVGKESGSQVHAGKTTFLNKMRKLPLIAAACTALMVVVWFLMPRYFPIANPNYLTSRAAPAKTTEVYLADGSKVTLNSGSVLRYPEKFGPLKREVYLEGEAYFEVKHDSEKAFLVHTGKVTTVVLGTSFNVAAYKNMPAVAVTVLTGKVGVNNGTKKGTVLLNPKQRAVLNAASHTIDVDSIYNLSDAIAWKTGKMVFSGASLDEVCLKLGYRFGVNVSYRITRKHDMKISGSFSRQPLESIIKAICELSGTQYKYGDAGYVIY